MKRIKVRLKENSYSIVIGNGILPQLGRALKAMNIGQDAVIVTMKVKALNRYAQRAAASLKKADMTASVIAVPEGKSTKSFKQAEVILNKITAHDVKRKVFIIALGGGIIGDLAGFIAAIYKRGVPYIQVPTTLLAQIDSSIGGKVAVDLPEGKNLVGAFYHPKIVWTDIGLLRGLPARQIRNGLAEAVKYGIIKDKELFVYMERNFKKILSCDPGALSYVVARCSQIKADVVERDEKETKGIRTILNFGHTIGHAIETASAYEHGEAVALGMRVASDISVQLGLLSTVADDRINALLSNIGLPRRIKGVTLNAILRIMQHDKKFKGNKNRFVLATAIGKVIVKEEIPLEVIRKAVKRYL